jgi:hypothetical protein
VQQHLPQQRIQRTGLSVQTPSSIKNDTLKIVTVVQQIITELSETIRKRQNNCRYKNGTLLNKTKWLSDLIARSMS